MIEGILFDFDDTLYNYKEANDIAFRCTTELFEHEYKIENMYCVSKDIIHMIKKSNNCATKFNKMIYFKKIFEHYNINLINLENYVNYYNKIFYENIKLKKDVLDLLELLKNNNIKIGMITNNIFSQQYEKLKYLNILKYFDCIMSSDENGEEKPNNSILLNILDKMKLNKQNIIIIGDSYEHDMCFDVFSILLNEKNEYIPNKKNMIQYNKFEDIYHFLNDYLKYENEFIYLSKYFGQSNSNVQGAGGNISIKLNDYLMLIKSSGCVLGNIEKNSGYCMINKNRCNHASEINHPNLLLDENIFGYGIPSMETFFHLFTKKYTIHLHFVLSNIFLCNEKDIDFTEYKNIIIDYFTPGKELADEIQKKYNGDIKIIFLKNHGLIITTNDYAEIFEIYESLFNHFNKLLENKYDFSIFNIHRKINKNIIIKKYEGNYNKIKNMIYCFPDLLVFCKKIKEINHLDELNDYDTNIILYDNNIFLINKNLIKSYDMSEILDSYMLIYSEESVDINDNKLLNLEHEKYRKNK